MNKKTTNKIKINVTKNDIAKGKRGRTNSCPIALACKRVKELSCVKAVGGLGLYTEITDGSFERVSFLPTRAAKFVMDFDSGNEVKPFSFTVKVSK